MRVAVCVLVDHPSHLSLLLLLAEQHADEASRISAVVLARSPRWSSGPTFGIEKMGAIGAVQPWNTLIRAAILI